MEWSRYSIKPNAGKGLSGFIINLNVAGEFDPAWLDSNKVSINTEILGETEFDPAWLDSNPNFLGADLPIKTHAELRFQR